VQEIVGEQQLGLLLARLVTELGLLEVALRAGLQPVLDRVGGEEISHDVASLRSMG
jgi:hypothetical protein